MGNNAGSVNDLHDLKQRREKKSGSQTSLAQMEAVQWKWKKEMSLELKKLGQTFSWPKLVLQRLERDSLFWESVQVQHFTQFYNIGEKCIKLSENQFESVWGQERSTASREEIISNIRDQLQKSHLIEEEILNGNEGEHGRRMSVDKSFKFNTLIGTQQKQVERLSCCVQFEALDVVQRRVGVFNGCTELLDQIFNCEQKSILRKINQLFKLEFLKKWQSQLDKRAVQCSEMDQEVWIFVKSLVGIVCAYFQIEEFIAMYRPFSELLTKCNLTNLMMNLVFDEQIYCLVYEAKKMNQMETNKCLDRHIQELRCNKDDPSYFGVSAQYCLNDHTKELLKKNQNKSRSSSNDSIQTEDVVPLVVVNLEQSPQRPFQKKCEGSLIEESRLSYRSAIKALNAMQLRSTPFFKVKSLLQCFDRIFESIQSFYASCGESKNQLLDSDELLNIFTYVLCHCSIANLYTHVDMMRQFFCKSADICDYYITVMEAVVEMIKTQ